MTVVAETGRPNTNEDNGDTVCITILEMPDPALGKALAMRSIFFDSMGINAEMKQDGVEVATPGSSVLREMQNAVADVGPDLGIFTGPAGRERQHVLEKREEVLEKVGHAADNDGFLKKLLFPIDGEGINLGRAGRLDLAAVMNSSRVWYHLSIHPTDESPASLAALPSVTSAWSAGTVSRQLRAWRLPRVGRTGGTRTSTSTADFDLDEFVQRYAALGCRDGRDGIESWILERGWSNGEVVVGNERVWMRESPWWEAESMLDLKPMQGDNLHGMGNVMATGALESGYSANGSSYFQAPLADLTPNGSRDQLVHQSLHQRNPSQATLLGPSPLTAPSIAPSAARNPPKGDYGLGTRGDDMRGQVYYTSDGEFIGLDPELADGKKIEERPITASRRTWVIIVWTLTFWIPSPLLRYVGRMKRPDVRMAWREKLVLCFFIALANGAIVFWIIWFGHLLCPNWDKAWAQNEVAFHQGTNDYWVSVHGKVYDMTPFWRLQHSDIVGRDTDQASMLPLAGLNLDEYFVAPLSLTCPGLGIADTTTLLANNTIDFVNALHTSGANQPVVNSALRSQNWYVTDFLPTMQEYYKGDLVWDTNFVQADGTTTTMPGSSMRGTSTT